MTSPPMRSSRIDEKRIESRSCRSCLESSTYLVSMKRGWKDLSRGCDDDFRRNHVSMKRGWKSRMAPLSRDPAGSNIDEKKMERCIVPDRSRHTPWKYQWKEDEKTHFSRILTALVEDLRIDEKRIERACRFQRWTSLLPATYQWKEYGKRLATPQTP